MADSPFVLTAQLNLRPDASIGRVLDSLEKRIEKLSKPIKVKIQTEVSGGGSGGSSSALQKIEKDIKAVSQVEQDLCRQILETDRYLKEKNRSTRLASANLNTLAGSIISVYGAYRLLRGELGRVIEFEKQLAAMAQIRGTSLQGSKSLGGDILKAGSQYGANPNRTASAMNSLLQAGLSSNEINVSTIAKLSLNSQVQDLDKTVKMMLLLRNVYGQTQGQIEDTYGTLINLAKQSSVSVEGLSEAVSLAGGVWKTAGGNVLDLASTMSVLSNKTQLSASELGHGVKFIVSRISSMPEVVKKLQDSFGIRMYENNQFVGIAEGFERIGRALNSLPEGSKAKMDILQTVAGSRQINVAANLFQNLNEAVALKNQALRAGNSLDKDASTAQETLANKIEKTRNNILRLSQSLYDSKFSGWADSIVSASDALASMGPHIEKLIPLVTGLAGAWALNKGAMMLGGMGRRGLAVAGVGAGIAGLSATGHDTASNALAAGAGGFMMGATIHPFVGAIAGATLALNSLANSARDARKATFEKDLDTTGKGISLAVQNTKSYTSGDSLAAIAAQGRVIGDKWKALPKESQVGYFESLLPGRNWGDQNARRIPLQSEAEKDVYQKSQTAMADWGFSLRDELVNTSKNFEEFQDRLKKAGVNLSQIASLAGVKNFDAQTRSMFQQRLQSQIAGIGATSYALPGAPPDKKAEKANAKAWKEYYKDADTVGARSIGLGIKSAESYRSANLSFIDRQKTANVMAGGYARSAVDTNDVAKDYARDLTGTDDITRIAKERVAVEQQVQQAILSGADTYKTLQERGRALDSAFSALTDVGGRLKSTLEDVDLATKVREGGLSGAEAYLSMNRRQRRDFDRGKGLAEGAFSNPNGFDGMNDRNRKLALGYMRFAGVDALPGMGLAPAQQLGLTPEATRERILSNSTTPFQPYIRGAQQQIRTGQARAQAIRQEAERGQLTQADAYKAMMGLGRSFDGFAQTAPMLAQSMDNFPRTMTGEFTHSVNVVINGADTLASLEPGIQSMIQEKMQEAFGRWGSSGQDDIPESMRDIG